MARDFEQIQRAQQHYAGARTANETLSLPPGYIQGFGVTLRKDYTVTVNGGSANVQGKQVKLDSPHQLALEDWVVPRMDTPQHYYIYLAAGGQIYVDIVKPVFNDFYGYYEQPDYGWRTIGKLFTKSNNIIYAIKDIERSGRTVTVAPADYVGYADYYCDGANDDILINAAIQYMFSAYFGGTINLLEGTFILGNHIRILDSISLNGSNKVSILKAASGFTPYLQSPVTVMGAMVVSSGSASTPIRGISCGNLYFDTSLTNAIALLLNYNNSPNIENNYFKTSQYYALYLQDCNYAKVINNEITSYGTPSILWGGIELGTVNYSLITNNIIHSVSATTDVVGIDFVGGYNQITNNEIYDFTTTTGTSYGIEVNNVNCIYNLISGNKIRQLKNSVTATNVKAIDIVTGTSTSVNSNYCYNNGSDTGIANTNGNNFSDYGTDTQVYSNSWQSPVAGEPSLGTPHPHHGQWANASTLGVQTLDIDLSGYFPVGSTFIYVNGYYTGGAANSYLIIEDTSGNQYANPSGASDHFEALVMLDSSRKFRIVIGGAQITLTGWAHFYGI